MCIICQSPVRNESVWPVHINAKQHRDNIARKRAVQKEVQSPVSNIGAKIIQKQSVPVTTPTEPMKVKGKMMRNSVKFIISMKFSLFY